MTDYVERHLEVDRGEANRLRTLYWHRYGATLLGLVRHHAVDADALPARDPRLRRRRARARRARAHAAVRAAAGAQGAADECADGLCERSPARPRGAPALPVPVHDREACALHGTFRPKPSRMMLRAMLARERVPAAHAVLVEDSVANLKAARALGFRTVLMTGHGTRTDRGARLHAAPPGGPCRPRDPVAAPVAAGPRAPASLRPARRPR